jgi:hypothetical protein
MVAGIQGEHLSGGQYRGERVAQLMGQGSDKPVLGLLLFLQCLIRGR